MKEWVGKKQVALIDYDRSWAKIFFSNGQSLNDVYAYSFVF